MPRRSRPSTTTRSEHWLRLLLNTYPHLINSEIQNAFGWNGDKIQWVSPIESDGYAEYYDESFLQVLGMQPTHVPLHDFWPKSGPRWDGLGKTSKGRLILVEAKAHIEEAADSGTKAGPESRSKIEEALIQTRQYLKIRPDAVWDGAFYQYANRIAHLYYLHVLNKLDAYLVFVYFLNADDVPAPCSLEQWKGAIRVIKAALGVRQHRLSPRIGEVFIDTGNLKASVQHSP